MSYGLALAVGLPSLYVVIAAMVWERTHAHVTKVHDNVVAAFAGIFWPFTALIYLGLWAGKKNVLPRATARVKTEAHD